MEVIKIVWGYERRWIGSFAIPIACIFIRCYYMQYTNFRSLGDKKSVVVSPSITVHTLIKKGEIKTVSVLTRLPGSLIPSRSLNWLNGLARENIFDVDCWNREVKSCWDIEEGSFNGCKDDLVNKWGWNREVKIDWSIGMDLGFLGTRLKGWLHAQVGLW